MRTLWSETCKHASRTGGRRRRPSFSVVALSAALAAGPALAAEPHQLTTEQMKALPPEQADRVIKQDLLSVLQPVGQLSQRRWRYLHNVDLTTRAIGAGYEGLCRRDVVRLRYAPTEDAGPYPDRPIRPFSVEAKAQFALRGAPPLVAARAHDPGRVWGTDCGRLSDDATAPWFYAPDAREAALAVNLLDATRSRLRAGTLAAPCMNCNLTLMKEVEPRNLVRIRSCTAEAGMVCYQFQLRSTDLVTVVARHASAFVKVSADDVVSVREATLLDDDPDAWP